LTGFVLGSLNKIWPWKRIVETKIIEGKVMVIKEQSISPFEYGENNQLMFAIAVATVGFLFIILLEKVSVKK
jgi:putative membrane protein